MGAPSVVPAESSPTRRVRVGALDVARAVALVGVFSQNYVVAFNTGPLARRAWPDAFHGWLARAVDLYQGPLTTRFAAALVTIFGIGLTLLSQRSGFTPWIAARRGLLLFVGGMWFNTAWPGTILPFYGMYLILLAAWTKVRRDWILPLSALIITALTFAFRTWVVFAMDDRTRLSGDLAWLVMRDSNGGRIGLSNPRGFAGSMLFWGAHPLLPWLAFVLVGMWIGRQAWQTTRVQQRMIAAGLAMIVVGYGVASVMTRHVSTRWKWAWSTTLASPYFDAPIKYDGPLYVLVTIGSSLAGIGLVLLVATKFSDNAVVRWIAGAGTVTLTLYVLHGLIPAIVFRWFLDSPHLGVGWAFLLANAAWIGAMVAGGWWARYRGVGPLEWVLRRFGG